MRIVTDKLFSKTILSTRLLKSFDREENKVCSLIEALRYIRELNCSNNYI